MADALDAGGTRSKGGTEWRVALVLFSYLSLYFHGSPSSRASTVVTGSIIGLPKCECRHFSLMFAGPVPCLGHRINSYFSLPSWDDLVKAVKRPSSYTSTVIAVTDSICLPAWIVNDTYSYKGGVGASAGVHYALCAYARTSTGYYCKGQYECG